MSTQNQHQEPFSVEATRLFANRYMPDSGKRRLHEACDEIERCEARADAAVAERQKWETEAHRLEEQLEAVERALAKRTVELHRALEGSNPAKERP